MQALWDDGRTGEAGCLAGNLVLLHIRDRTGEQFTQRKGTTFRGKASIWVGRMCSSDSYLNARDRHWANISLEQHLEVTSEARLEGAKVKYLLITASAGQPEIHYWIIPGDLIDRIAFQDNARDLEYVYSLHVREKGSGFEIDGHDVSAFHHVIRLDPGDAVQLDRAFERTRQIKNRRRGARQASTLRGGGEGAGGFSEDDRVGEFVIPLKGGRAATLSIPMPSASVDLERIKGWIDLMSDVLTESSNSNDASLEARRQRAVRAVLEMQRKSVESGRNLISAEEIDAEIRAARRERR